MTTLTAAQPQLPIYDLQLRGAAARNWTPRDLTIKAVLGRHDEATLKALVADANAARWRDAPVSFVWGTPRKDTFNGYVVDVAKAQNFQAQPLVTMTIDSPSWKLSTGTPTFWEQQPVTRIAQQLAARHRMSVVVDPTDYVVPRLAQTNESDWKMLQRLADMVSFVVGEYNGVLWLLDPLRALESRQSVARLVKSTNTLDSEALLLDFQPIVTSEHDRTTFDPRWGYFSTSGTPTIVRPDGTQFKSNYLENAAVARQAERRTARSLDNWTMGATARIRGTTRIRPGHVVEIITGATSSVTDTYDGFWFVLAARSTINDAAFQTTLVLARDKTRIGAAQPYRPFWGRNPKPEARLIGDTWCSTGQSV